MVKRTVPILIAIFLAAGLTACALVSPNSNDKTPPSSVVIRIKDANGQWLVQPSITYYQGQSIDVWCTAEDPDGMKLLRVEYHDVTSDTCKLPTGQVSSGPSYPISVPQPVEWKVGYSGDKVATVIFGYIKVAGPFTCTNFSAPPPNIGWPVNHTLTLRCIATNQSSDPQAATASANLNILLK